MQLIFHKEKFYLHMIESFMKLFKMIKITYSDNLDPKSDLKLNKLSMCERSLR